MKVWVVVKASRGLVEDVRLFQHKQDAEKQYLKWMNEYNEEREDIRIIETEVE